MSLKEFRQLDEKALLMKIEDLKKDLVTLRLKASMGQLGNVKEINKVKKQVAQVYTLLNEKGKAAGGAA